MNYGTNIENIFVLKLALGGIVREITIQRSVIISKY